MINKNSIFSKEDAASLVELSGIAISHFYDNSKRVVNSLYEILMIVKPYFLEPHLEKEKRKILRVFKQVTSENLNDLMEELIVACLNTAQYDRGLEVLNMLVEIGVKNDDDVTDDKAELHALLGSLEIAETILVEALNRNPKDVFRYIALGDLYYLWQIQDEKRNFAKAEEWYYKAYDLGLADKNIEGGRILLERLGDVCVERLRRNTFDGLIDLLKRFDIGGWETFVGLRDSVYLLSNESIMLSHLESEVMRRASPIESDQALQILITAYNFMPQRNLNDLCPFEMVEFFPMGENEIRFREEIFKAWEGRIGAENKKEMDARFSEGFSRFQEEFLKEKDPVTGKTRWGVQEDERKKIRKLFKNGKLIWTGFLKYRNAPVNTVKIGRNDPCPCGSGKKYKKCHGK